MALALARKYRPRNFGEVAVQTHVSETLRGAIERDRVAHGYLFCGPRGTGKTTLARVLAMALNCENKGGDGEPCGICDNCRRIWSGSSSLDVVEIDAASNRGVDDARELRERAMYAPSGDDRYKVYIVDEAHMLTREAWNALLKVLEEPPPRVVFVFATTEPEKIAQYAAPVLSRLQRFDLKRIGTADIIDRLTSILKLEDVSVTPEALAMIARAADGSMRDSLSLTDQVISVGDGVVSAEAVAAALGLIPEDEYLAILELIANGRAGDVFSSVSRLRDEGVDFGTFLTGFTDLLRAQLSVMLGGSALGMSPETEQRLRDFSSLFTAGDIVRMLNAISEVEQRFKKSGQQQLLIELLLVRFALMDRTLTLDDVLSGLGGATGASSATGGGSSGRTAAQTSQSASPPQDHSRSLSSDGGVSNPRDWRAALRNADAAAGNTPAAAATSTPATSSEPASRPQVTASAPAAPAAPTSHTPLPPSSPVPSPARQSAESDGPPSMPVPPIELYDREEVGGGNRANASRASGIVESMKRAMEEADQGKIPTRLTDEQLKKERMETIRSRDPIIGGVIDALDLELLD